MAVFRILTTLAASVAVVTGQAASNPNDTAGAIYKNPSASIDDRIADLLPRMTLEDKMAQLMQGDMENWTNLTTNAFNYTGLVANMETKASQFYVGHPVPQQWISDAVRRAQDYLMQNTTLGIPALVQTEGIHGFLINNATIFNSPIGYACSFNPDLIQQMGVAIGTEAAALGVNQLFVNLARELRYGRVEETFGEDPYLTGEIAYAYIVGLQSRNVSATVKHFVAYSAPEQGLNTGPVHGGIRELRTTWTPSFKRAIVDAGAMSIMSNYASYDGLPNIADYFTLTEILRNEWGYNYFVTSDSGGTDRICTAFKMCQSDPLDMEAVTMYALPAGNDVEMGGGSFNYRTIPELVTDGTLDISVVDTAVSRVLRTKFTLGVFEHPNTAVPANETVNYIHTPEHIALAREIDSESIVLLENSKGVLPISKDAHVAVIGPMASGVMNYGDYVVYNSKYRGVTPLAGMQDASTGTITYAQGCIKWSNDESGFPEAIAAANAADVAVVVVGTWSRDQNQLWEGLNATTGEHVDLSSLNLVGAMAPLVKAIIDTGKPTVVVYSSGKPITEPWISSNASALVQQFYPSEQGGNALADVLYGDVNPSGKLSVGFPFSVGTAPIYYDYLNSGRVTSPGMAYANGSLLFGHEYVLNTPVPQYPFGYGLSYTDFSYSNVTLSATNVSATDNITATVNITNNGTMDGKEVVQFYVVDSITSVAVPNIELKAFEKVMIEAGQTEQVEVSINVADLGLWNVTYQYAVEPGQFVVWVGASSADLRGNATFYVT